MRFEIGNEVAVLDDTLKGIVIQIQGETIDIQDTEGMVYQFQAEELVLIGKSQHELSKFSDINHPLLREKVTFESSLRRQSLIFGEIWIFKVNWNADSRDWKSRD